MGGVIGKAIIGTVMVFSSLNIDSNLIENLKTNINEASYRIEVYEKNESFLADSYNNLKKEYIRYKKDTDKTVKTLNKEIGALNKEIDMLKKELEGKNDKKVPLESEENSKENFLDNEQNKEFEEVKKDEEIKDNLGNENLQK